MLTPSATTRVASAGRLTTAAAARCLVAALAVACGRNEDPPPPPQPAPARPAATATTAAAPGAPQGDAASVLATRADRARIQGNESAAVWVVEISDFQCPYCKMWHDSTYPALKREYVETGKVRMAYLNLPLPSHANAWPAAEAAMCAGVQGRFWEMHDALFDTQERWAPRQDAEAFFADSLAGRAGANAAALRSCMAGDRTRPLIQADFDRSVASGVQSTPTFIVGDGARLQGAAPVEEFRRVIDSVLAQKAGRAQQR